MAETKTNGTAEPSKGEWSQIEHSNVFLAQLESEIYAVKTGELSESVGRVVLAGRKTQLKFAELQLQMARLMKGKATEMPGLLLSAGKSNAAA